MDIDLSQRLSSLLGMQVCLGTGKYRGFHLLLVEVTIVASLGVASGAPERCLKKGINGGLGMVARFVFGTHPGSVRKVP